MDHPQATYSSNHAKLWTETNILTEKVHHTTQWIDLIPPKRNNKILLNLLNLHPNPSQIPTNIINYLISKTLQNIPCLVLIKPT